MIKFSSQLLELFKDPKTLSLVLGSAGASGLAGGLLSSKADGPKGESPKDRRRRILRTALLTAGLGGGAAAAGTVGMRALHNALPADDIDPVTQIATSPAARGAMGLGLFSILNRHHAAETTQAQKSLLSTMKGVARAGSHDPKIQSILSSISADGTGLAGNFAKNRKAMLELLAANGGSQAEIRNALLNANLPVHAGSGFSTALKNTGARLRHNLTGTNSELAHVARMNPRTRAALSAAAIFTPEIISGVGNLVSGSSDS